MMKFRKSMLLPLSAISLILTACGGTSAPTSSVPASVPASAGDSAASSVSDGITHVVFWHTLGDVKAGYLDNLAKKFNKEHENVEVVCSQVTGSYDDLQSMILSNSATGGLPTMSFCYPDNVAEYLDRNIVVDMSRFFDDEQVGFKESDGSSIDGRGNKRVGADDYLPAFWDEGREFETEGQFCVPFSKSTEALFYNKNKFDAMGYSVPTTWQEMWELCRTIRADFPEVDEKTNDYKVYPLGYDSDENLFITLCEQNGYGYTTNDIETHRTHFIFNNNDVKGMLSELKGYYDDHLFKTKGTTANSTYTSSAFTAGDILMSIGSTGGTSYQDTDNFEVGVASLPCVDRQNPAFVSQGPDICFYNRSSEAELRTAWEFYRYISSAGNNASYGLATGYQPVRYSSYESAEYTDFLDRTDDENLMKKVAILCQGLQESYFTSPVFLGSAVARNEVGSALAAVLLGEKTIDKALDDAMSNCVNAVRQRS